MKKPTQTSIVLLSGGMDSATALYWANKNTQIAAILFFNYNQRGWQYEWEAATAVANQVNLVSRLHHIRVPTLWSEASSTPQSSLLARGANLNPVLVDADDLPLTFVPGRNLIFIALAAPYVYAFRANLVVLGVSDADVSYPDCTQSFLTRASMALETALGRNKPGHIVYEALSVYSPVMNMDKARIVMEGQKLGVLWHLTRSCYGDDKPPCGGCDSCVKRAKAFYANGIRDPLYDEGSWRGLTASWGRKA